MKNVPTYEELAERLDCYVYDTWYRDQPGEWHKIVKPGVKLPPIRVFDHRFTSMYQLCAYALEGLRIVKFINRSCAVFQCEPIDFRLTALKNQAAGCSYDTLVLALVWIVEEDVRDLTLLRCLAQLGLCEPEFKEVPAEFSYLDFSTMKKIPVKVLGKTRLEVVWTKRKDYYDKLGKDWTSLV